MIANRFEVIFDDLSDYEKYKKCLFPFWFVSWHFTLCILNVYAKKVSKKNWNTYFPLIFKCDVFDKKVISKSKKN